MSHMSSVNPFLAHPSALREMSAEGRDSLMQPVEEVAQPEPQAPLPVVEEQLEGPSEPMVPEEDVPEPLEQQAANPIVSDATRDAILVMKKGWVNDAPLPEAAPSVSSREWRNRAAKTEAKRFITPGKTYKDIDVAGIWGHVLRAEGGYANNPDDPGGETKFGISKRSYPDLDIANITADDAQQIFKKDFFDKVGGDVLLKINPGLAAHVADMAFNAGPRAAIRLMYDAAGLPRESQITPELIDRLNDSEEIIKNYSVARLKYYSSLGNAPTFIRGWTNRVNQLNKALGVKSGLNGAYKAARALDVDTLVQTSFGTIRNSTPVFAELTETEREYLKNSNLMLSPGYVPRKGGALINDNKRSSLGEVFKATYDDHFFLNTIDGLESLMNNAAYRASEENRKALGDKFDKSLLEKMTFGLYGGVTNLKEWEAEVKKFKAENPGIKLPYESVADVYARAHVVAKQIEKRYQDVNSGSFTSSLSDAIAKAAHVALGYLPAHITASFSDRAEAALNLIPMGGFAGQGIKGLAKGAAVVMGGVGATQTAVQPTRSEIGLDSGFQQGATQAVVAGAGYAALAGLGQLIGKVWKSSPKVAAETTDKIADTLETALKQEIPDETRQHLLREVDDLRSFAEMHKKNPYGSDYQAKAKFEKNLGNALDDMAHNRPVRLMDDQPTKYVPTPKEYTKAMNKVFDGDPDFEGKDLFNKAIKEWNTFKRESIKQQVFDSADDIPYSTVPVTKQGALGPEVLEFPTREDAVKFLDSPDGKAIGELADAQITKGPNGFYFAKAADMEPENALSGRMYGDDAVDVQVGDVRGKAFKDSPDVAVAQQFPEYSRIKELGDVADEAVPKYPKHAQEYEVDDFLQSWTEAGKVKIKGLDDSYEAAIKQLDAYNTKLSLTQADGTPPRLSLDEGLDLDTETFQTVDEILKGFKEEKSAIQQIFTCMTGV